MHLTEELSLGYLDVFGPRQPVQIQLGNTFAAEAPDDSWEKSFYSHPKAALLKPFPASLPVLSIQRRETSRVCAFAILHPSALESGLNKR